MKQRLARSLAPIGAAALLATLTGCPTVGPDYVRPDAGTSNVMPGVADVTTASTVGFTSDAPWGRWWEVFHDRDLEILVDNARSANQDLRAAYARVGIARSLVRQAFAPLLPNVGAIGAYQYVRLPPLTGSSGGSSGGSTSGPLAGDPFQVFAGVGSLSYEFDFWGRVRRQLEASNADERASEEDRKVLELAVTADTVQAYFDVGEADAEVAIAREAVSTRSDTLGIVRKRVDTGFATELELRRAEAEVASAEAEVKNALALRSVAEHRLAILTGRLPTLHFDGKPPSAFDVPPEIPIGIPASLLERRPDVRAAEERLHAQNARIGQAIAGFFPSLTIQGFAGYTALDVSKIANPNAQFWAAGPVLRLPIFQGGLTRGQVLEAEARTDEATANYQATVLRAFGEVADAIVRIAADRGMVADRKRQVDAAQRAVSVAQTQYERGFILYLDVLDAQRSLLAARQALVRVQRQLLADFVQLARALGGGWTELPKDQFQDKLVAPLTPEGD